jgi:hypothetical protein
MEEGRTCDDDDDDKIGFDFSSTPIRFNDRFKASAVV